MKDNKFRLLSNRIKRANKIIKQIWYQNLE